MTNEYSIKKIAEIYNGYTEKFGIPRQSGLAGSVVSQIIFEPEYRVKEAFRELENFSHIWIIWQFSRAVRDEWSPTVRPPRLGGNKRIGVFATRSPFRPNPLGLSCVKLEKIEYTKDSGPVLVVSGADLMNGTPIFDIKPYIPYADCHPEAQEGFTGSVERPVLKVEIDEDLTSKFDIAFIGNVKEIIAQDPRPAYQDDAARVYKMKYGCHDISFTVSGDTAQIIDIMKEKL